MQYVIKKISLVVSFMTLGTYGSAQKADSQSQSILEAVTSNYKANQNTYFKFTFATGINGKISKTQTGIFYTTPSQYKLKIMGIEQIYDGHKVYNISEEDKEITISKATGTEMMFSPTNYLETYKKDYNTSYIGKKIVNGRTTDLIKLTPVKSNGIKNVFLFVDQPKKRLVKIEQYNTNEEVSIIIVQDYKTNQKLSSDLFRFNKNLYKDYIITEL